MQQSAIPMMQSSEMGALTLRKTFIELAQPAPADEAAMLLTSEEVSSSRLRSASEPASPRNLESAEVFSDDRAYVRNLDAVLQTVWASSPFGARLVDSGVAAPHPSFCTSSVEQTQSPRRPQTAMEQPHQAEKGSMDQEQLRASKSSSAAKWSTAAISQEDAAAVAGSSDSTRVATRESSSDGAATTSESASMTSGAQSSSFLWRGGLNDGSVGHPGLCARPCLFFEAGQCANGTSCEFCHLPHEKREVVQAKRNKKRWDALKQMRPRKAATLILPILKEKILSFDDSEDTSSAVDRLVAACGFASSANDLALQPRSSGGAALARALHESGLRTLVVTLERTALKDLPEAQEAAEALLRQLRVVCRQRGVMTTEAQWDSDDV